VLFLQFLPVAEGKGTAERQDPELSTCQKRPVRLAYQPPANSIFLSEQTSHQQPANSTFLSEQISTSHQQPAKRTGFNGVH
jgi:hypothetical protein